MAARTPQDAGKEFAAGVLQHLPDALRAQMETFLASPDATSFLTDVGNGTLRQADYSRAHNELQARQAALTKWHGELTQWVNDNQDTGGAPGGPTAAAPAPVADAPTPSLTRDDIQTEFARREGFYAAFTAEAVRLAQQHQMQFGEVLDINVLLNHPRLGELRMDGAYQDVFKDKIAARNADIAAKDRKKLEDEIRAQVLTEIGQQPASSALPYPVGGSPLDHLTPAGEAPKAFDPNAATVMYNQLVAGRQ